MSYCKTEASGISDTASTQRGIALIPILLVFLTTIASIAAVWQWQRSEFHSQKASRASSQLLQPKDLNTDAAVSDSFVKVTGTWIDNSTTFVSPRIVDGRTGAQIVSVLRYTDGAGKLAHIAVQRGWAAMLSPNVAPNIASLTSSPVTLAGELLSGLARAYELKHATPDRLGLWQNYDIAAHSKLVGVPLQPQILVLLPNSPDTERQQLRRTAADQTIDQLRRKASSNLGYALQWLGLALVGLVGLAWMWRSRKK